MILHHRALLQGYDIVLHAFDVDLIVEVYYIFSFAISAWHLHINIDYAPLALKHLRILIDYVIELDLGSILDLAYAIDGAHNHLVKHSVD